MVTTQILTTKLYIPPPRPSLVSRPHLIERLNHGLKGKFILVSAPAGFGKTTLLSEWVHQSKLPCGWLSLDGNDNDLGRFLAYLIASLQSINLGVDAQLPTLLQSPKEYTIEAILIPLINQIVSKKQRFALVLDDYHLIQSEDIHTALAYLLDYLPPNMHIVIASRADPPLPLARLRARGQMIEIRASHLRFSVEDVKDFLNQIRGLNLSQEDLQRLNNRTDGWIAGLQMASIALEGKSDPSDYIRSFSGSQDYIADFLTTEVFHHLSETLQYFLLKTSILDRLSAALCDAITGQNNAQQVLRQLRDGNLFLIPLDDESHWYRYHRLFADLNSQRLIELHPDKVSELYLKASEWFDGNGFPAEAIDYAFRGNHIQRAAALIEEQAEATLIRSEISTFIRWMQKLPHEVICEKGSLCIYYAWALLVSGEEPQSAILYLDQVTPTDDQVKSRLDVVKSMLAFSHHKNIPKAIELARQALARLPEDDFFFRQIAAWNLSATLFISGDSDGGAKMLEEVARVSTASKNYLVAIITLCRLGSYQMQKGDLFKAKGLFDRALTLASDDPKHPLPVACEALFGLGKIHWEWYQLEIASKYLVEGIELSKRWREVAGIGSYIILAHSYQSQGDLDRANQMIEVAKKLAAQSVDTDTDDKYVASEEAFLRLRQGDIHAVEQWANARGLKSHLQDKELGSTPKHGDDIILRYELLVFARFLIAVKQPEKALTLLGKILPSMDWLGYRAKIIETHILTAIGWQALGVTGQAFSSLEKALTLAESAGFVRLFSDQDQALASLIKKATTRGRVSSFATTLLASYSSDQGKRTTGLIEPLSKREIEVLRLLVSELPVPEIADHLNIAVSTLRTHIRNIYSKLGVNSRFEATSKASELDLL